MTAEETESPLVAKGRVLCDLGRHEEVLTLLMPELAGMESQLEGYLCCLLALQSLGRHQESLTLAERALAIYPGDSGLLALHVTSLVGSGLFSRALEQVDIALARDHENGIFHYLKAFSLHMLGFESGARESAERAVAAEPSSAQYRILLARLEYQQGDRRRALELIQEVLADDPLNVEALSLQGELSRGLWQKLRLFKRSLSLDPADVGTRGLYLLYARNFPKDLALMILLVLAVSLTGLFPGNKAADLVLDQCLWFAILCGFYLIGRSAYHLVAYILMFALLFTVRDIWQGNYHIGRVPVGLIFGMVGGISVMLLKFSVIDTVSGWKENWDRLLAARPHGRALILLKELLPPRVMVACLGLAILPSLFLFGLIYKPPHEQIIASLLLTAPALYYAAGITSFFKCLMASLRFAALLLLPMIFISLQSLHEVSFRLWGFVLLYGIALFLAHRLFLSTMKDESDEIIGFSLFGFAPGRRKTKKERER